MADKKMPRGAFVYKSYNFLKLDPALDVFKTVAEDSGMTLRQIYEAGGATPGTLNRWIRGNARSCRFDTWAASVRACKSDVVVKLKSGEEIEVSPKNSKNSKR